MIKRIIFNYEQQYFFFKSDDLWSTKNQYNSLSEMMLLTVRLGWKYSFENNGLQNRVSAENKSGIVL